MSNELAVLQNELTLERQRNEIMQLKYELQKSQIQKSSRLEDSLFSPNLYQHYQKVADTLARSNVIPTIYKGKPEDIFVAMAMGYQLGFPVEQSLQDIAVINGRPCLWGDGLMSLALNHPECQSITEEPILQNNNVIGYRCTVIRRGHEPHTKQFTLQDASVAGLLSRGTVWKSYPERMLQMRARSLALRDKFADALRGLRIAEIEEDDTTVIEAEIVNPGATQTEKVKNTIKSKKAPTKTTATIIPNEAQWSTEEATQEEELPPVHNAGKDDEPISDEQIAAIKALMKEKNFSAEREEKALGYYKVKELDNLSDAQARLFLLQLEKA